MSDELIRQPVAEVDDFDQVWSQEEALMAKGVLRVGARTWSRDDLHTR